MRFPTERREALCSIFSTWNKFFEKIHALVFAAAVFKIGEKYLNFDMDRACYSEAWRRVNVDEHPMLKDLLVAGIYGSSDMSRKHSSNITLNSAVASKKGRRDRTSVIKTILPPAKSLVVDYPYLKKNSWLLPVAWMTRIFKYVKESIGAKDNSAKESLKIGKKRVELLKLYRIIKE